MITRPKILLIDDDAGTRFGFAQYLSSSGYDVTEAGDLSCAARLFASQKFNAAVIDVNLPDGSGLDFIRKIRSEGFEIPIIIITGAGDISLAVEAMRKGADNFLVKPVDMQGLELFLKKSLAVGVIKKLHSSQLRLEKKERVWFGLSIGMREVAELARIAAENDSPVLITGETGTGKGMLARWIHRHSNRSSYAIADVNCSGLKDDLLARELFGNVRGAFTSADRDREGLLDIADQGTLFLDEICEMDNSIQAQFLKVLEEKTYRRLGDTKLQQSDFRLICATNKHVENEIQKGNFRRDLYFRINLLTIHVPPLRERIDDLPDLVRHILSTGKSPKTEITEEAIQMLKTYPWPGNVRELKNVLERAIILSHEDPLTLGNFSWLKSTTLSLPPNSTNTDKTLEEVEHVHMISTLERCNGDVTKAAKRLGISRATLYRKLKAINYTT